jgi:hypothetical protein
MRAGGCRQRGHEHIAPALGTRGQALQHDHVAVAIGDHPRKTVRLAMHQPRAGMSLVEERRTCGDRTFDRAREKSIVDGFVGSE